MIKKNIFRMNRLLISCLLFLFTLFLSHIHIPLVSSIGLIPDYFLALFTTLIATRFINMNIYIYFLIGLIIDLLAGELIGQYGLVFIIIYFTNFLLNKFFLFKSPIMLVSQHMLLISIGLIVLLISSLNYELSMNFNLFFMKWIVTCLVCLLFHELIQYLSKKN